jgi:hypothetical protein
MKQTMNEINVDITANGFATIEQLSEAYKLIELPKT